MKLRLAFAGFRHGHIYEVHQHAQQRPDVEVVAACEEHAPTTQEVRAGGKVKLTHATYDELFGWGQFDILAVGDYYARRGELIIRALAAGKHAIADKPICTSLDELERISRLAQQEKLSVGCQLSMRDSGNMLALRQAVRDGLIGAVHTICFTGQHPLLRGKRPSWYFEPGKHGGTINDIGIHGLDAVEWLSGRRVAKVLAARSWNARVGDAKWFNDCGQFLLELDNGGGLIGDVSYLAPDSCGYRVPQYWRYTIHGDAGVAETSVISDGATVYTNGSDKPQRIAPAKPAMTYFDSFLHEIAGQRDGLTLSTQQVLYSSYVTLMVQKAADENLRDLPVK